MNTKHHHWLFLALLVGWSSALAEDRYDYCREKAQDISGYYGSVPAEYDDRGGAVRGTLKGMAGGVALSWLSGGDKKARKKAAKRGAALGLVIGALKSGEANKQRRENAEKRRRYEIELNACMAGR